MSAKKAKQKDKNSWYHCSKCDINIPQEAFESHHDDCPPSSLTSAYLFIKNEVLYGELDTRVNEDIKGISIDDRNNMVFLSQTSMQLCNFAIGEYVCIQDLDGRSSPNACITWPTEEKSSAVQILVTKDWLSLNFDSRTNIRVSVSKIMLPIMEATQATLIGMNIKNVEIFPDMLNRIQKTYLNKLLMKGNKIQIMYYGKILKFEMASIQCAVENCSNLSEDSIDMFSNMTINETAQFYKIINSTKFKIFRNEDEYKTNYKKENHFSQVGGLDKEIAEIEDLINVALGMTKTTAQSIITRGVLLYGASGTGKSLLAKALLKTFNVNTIEISMAGVYTSFKNNAEETLGKLLKDALTFTPSVVLIDDFDMFCPSKVSRMSDTDKKIMAHFLSLFDHIDKTPSLKIFIMATSNKPDLIDPSFRRFGRLSHEIEIPIPNSIARFNILKKLLQHENSFIDDASLKDIANSAYGFVGSDLASLYFRARLHSLRNDSGKICNEDFKYALTRVRPSAMREVQIEVPNIKWSDIGGQAKLKLILHQVVEWPLRHPDTFKRMGITPPRGVLMFGPPGCSKTMVAKALATESGLNFLSIKGPELFSKWVGESERAVRDLFQKARQVAPSVIFFDEIDALGSERSSSSSTSVQERVLAQLLTEMDGITPLGDVTILAATNRPDRIDKALLRPGRLDRIVYVPLPDDDTRKQIFKVKLFKMPIAGVDVDELTNLTKGYSGAEINAVCHEAAIKALEEDFASEKIEMRHFEEALKIVTPRTSPSQLKIYDDYLSL